MDTKLKGLTSGCTLCSEKPQESLKGSQEVIRCKTGVKLQQNSLDAITDPAPVIQPYPPGVKSKPVRKVTMVGEEKGSSSSNVQRETSEESATATFCTGVLLTVWEERLLCLHWHRHPDLCIADRGSHTAYHVDNPNSTHLHLTHSVSWRQSQPLHHQPLPPQSNP